MGRTKTRPGTTSRAPIEQPEPMDEDATPQDIREEFHAPFAIFNDDEGKDQGNKVNANEVFLLSSAKRKEKICPIYFIWSQLDLIKRRSAFHVSLTPIITCLAIHFKLIPSGAEFVPGQDSTDFRFIDDKELMRGNFIKDRHTIVPHHKRHCVIEYSNAKAAAGIAQGAGPSSHSDDEDEKAEAEPTASPELALTYPDAPLTQHHFDASMTAFQSHFDNVIGDFRRVLLARLDTQDRRISALETSWDSWTQRYPHPPPAGDQ
ncbi:uncharacterized protein LOC131017422 [Salvia miltiorrhiza]|uniref:uncharacterized protein LOC131017422 n=1 Tax=Salvia miltiorrhiza TaxID=226208 RepID=UPI0025ABD43F|nr:uncharacterized protein LOC131017422 [Salvia miltiorrhiza]